MKQWRHPVTRIIRILLVGDRAIFRSGLSALIESKEGLRVIGATGDRVEATKIATNENPDIILLNIDNEDELEFLPKLAAVAQKSRILVLSAISNCEAHEKALCLGARGVLLTDIPAGALIKAIERVHAGELWIGRVMLANVLLRILSVQDKPKLGRAQIAKLSKREQEILPLIGQCLKNKEIAARLFLSEATVRHHITSIFTKLGVSNRLDLVVRLSSPRTTFDETTNQIASEPPAGGALPPQFLA